VSGQADTGAYPGNLSLPREVREKILSTFRHTLDLYEDGKLDDCLIGCDFILKMDPRFAPARRLQEKARNPKAAVDLAELHAIAMAPPLETPPAPPPVAAPASPAPSPVSAPSPPPPSPPATGGFPGAGQDELSLDSLSLDAPFPDFPVITQGPEAGLPFDMAPVPGSRDELVLSSSDGIETTLSPEDLPDDLLAVAEPVFSSEEEIATLLRQGDDAQGAGERQQAIEIWSRIFLIDINNADAVSRIEKTREEMAEESRRAAQAVEAVRETREPGDPAAPEAELPAAPSSGEPEPAASVLLEGIDTTPISPPPLDLSMTAPPSDILAEEMAERVAVPAAPVAPEPVIAAERPRVRSLALPRINRKTIVLAALLLVLFGGGLFFVLRRPAGETAGARTDSAPSLEKATSLFREGRLAETIAELRRIPRGHSDYDPAQKLLASLTEPREQRAAAAAPESAPAPAAPPSAGGPDLDSLRADAEKALAEKRYIDALKSFSLAAPRFQGDPTFAQAMAAASEKVTELTPAVKLYNEGEYETAIPILWRIYQAGRDNQDARSYLVRAYYNQGITQLQNGLYEKAKESFGEVLSIDPQDGEAERHRQFAERYRSGDLDLLGRIYVRYVSPRP